MKFKIIYVVALSHLWVGSVSAHDTTHIHPLLTEKISTLIESKDIIDKSYQEIYIQLADEDKDPTIPSNLGIAQRLYWGTDFDPVGFAGAPDEVSYLGDNDVSPWVTDILVGAIPLKKNVITGVVYEDVPAVKVVNHFYHAKTGDALSFPFAIDSATRAMTFFSQSIENMGGYTDESKHDAFFLFGQALHHVEDMSSPAHIHNDAHLTTIDTEKDDYEGWWLPQQKINCGVNLDGVGCNYFSSATTINTVTNPWQDIWGTSGTSMVQDVYNSTTYHAVLEYTFSVFDEVAGSYDYFTTAGIVAAPQGEMTEMFPCPQPAATPDICLHWSEDAPDAPAHWVINSVGDFHHQIQVVDENSWWPIEIETNPDTIGQEPAPYNDTYYIEQLASNNSDVNPVGDVLIPASLRSNLGGFWAGNMQANNSTSMLQKYAETFLAPAVTYGAGFTQYWYDIANTPPFLELVAATQLSEDGSIDKTVYTAQWLPEIPAASIVEKRVLSRQSGDISHIHNKQDLILTLAFNEPIKEITLLRIGDFNTDGSCVSAQYGCADITPAAPIDGAPPTNVIFDPVKGDSIWQITVPISELNNLNGKLTLAVEAIDKNNHRDGGADISGSQLDGLPETPAKRNLSSVMNIDGSLIPQQNSYPWHRTDGEGGINDQFSYDDAIGDKSHILVFDNKGPTATINVDLTL